MNELTTTSSTAIERSVAIMEKQFELSQRRAKMYATSKLVPKQYQGNLADCTIALQMADRMGADPFMIMQNLYVVHGNPSFSAKFLISCLNACGRFTPLRYKMTGEKGTDSWGCIAWAKDDSGEVLESAEVTMAMAKAEGWYQKTGSKWQTMPELMLQYRAGAFFQRVYAPDVSMGMISHEEAVDMPLAQQVHISDSPLKDAEPTDALFAGMEPAEAEPEAASEPTKEPAEKDLTPVDQLSRSALIAEIKTHRGASYYTKHVAKGFDVESGDEATLRQAVAALRME